MDFKEKALMFFVILAAIFKVALFLFGGTDFHLSENQSAVAALSAQADQNRQTLQLLEKEKSELEKNFFKAKASLEELLSALEGRQAFPKGE